MDLFISSVHEAQVQILLSLMSGYRIELELQTLPSLLPEASCGKLEQDRGKYTVELAFKVFDFFNIWTFVSQASSFQSEDVNDTT